MPSPDYQLDKIEKILIILRRSNRVLGGIKERALPFQLNKLMSDCTASINATNEVIDHLEALKVQILEDMNMIEVPVEVKKPERHLRLVKK